MKFFGMLTLLFIGLKLTEYIDWSWWWVLTPMWIFGTIWFGLLFAQWWFIRKDQ